MKQRLSTFRINAMQRDVNPSVLGAAEEGKVHIYAYENYNMRINAVVEGEQFALVNEKGPKEIVNMGAVEQIHGIPIGQNVLNNTLTLFTVEEGDFLNINTGSIVFTDDIDHIIHDTNILFNHKDRIYTFNTDNTSEIVDGTLLYEGNLGFDYHNPIETVSYFENEKLQKVYWIDGLNQPRMVNIATEETERELWKNTKFDFVRTLKLQEQVTITKQNNQSGLFYAGTIQYCMTYFDKYGQESNVFYVSPIYYISYNDRGAEVNDSVANSFKIDINNLDTDFDYVRIYSIHRSAINSTPSCNIVSDIVINRDEYGWLTIYDRFTMDNLEDDAVKIVLRTGYTAPFGLDDILSGGIVTPFGESVCTVSENNTSRGKTYIFNSNDTPYKIHKIKIGDEGWIYPDENVKTAIHYNRLSKKVDIYYIIDNPAITNVRQHTMRAYLREHPAVTFTDTGTTNAAVDAFSILYAGGVEVSANAIAHKDNVLFLGNMRLRNRDIYDIVIPNTAHKEQLLYKILSESTDKSIFRFRNDVKHLKAWNANSYYSYDFQLNNNEFEIKTFKSREWYRFGLQFQHKSGVWSEPVWIGDAYNNLHPDCAYVNPNKDVGLITAEFDFSKTSDSFGISSEDFSNSLTNNGYVKVRPVAVYPEPYERESICQGYLNPTVFNYGDRMNGYCYAQASWFARPVITYSKVWRDSEWADYIQKDSTSPYTGPDVTGKHKFITGYSGRPLEYRHLCPIPTSMSFSSEIQSVFNHKDCTMYEDETEETKPVALSKEEFLAKYAGYFGVDQSVITMHTPDVESLYNLDLSKYKLRIIGMVPLTSFAGNIDIVLNTAGLEYTDMGNVDEDNDNTNTPRSYKFLKPHIFNPKIAISGLSWSGANIMGAGAYYSSKIYGENANKQTDHIGWDWDMLNEAGRTLVSEHIEKGVAIAQQKQNEVYIDFDSLSHNNIFIIYPWHRETSLINQDYGDVLFSKPQTKKLSNLRYSYNTFYFDDTWKPKNQLLDCQLIDSEETVFTKLKISGHNSQEYVLYKPNVDYIVTNTSSQNYSIKLAKLRKAVYGYYPNSNVQMLITPYSTEEEMYSFDFTPIADIIPYTGYKKNKYVDKHKYSSDPIHMKYKSSPHLVMSLQGVSNGTEDSKYITQNILPCFQLRSYSDTTIENNQKQFNNDFFGYSPYSQYPFNSKQKLFWDDSIGEVWQDTIFKDDVTTQKMCIDESNQTLKNKIYGFLWLGEIYNDNVENRFGGTTSSALENNKWVICGEAVDINKNTVVSWIGGDTYYQRYDNLKTYPYTLEDTNSVVDIISFMCETRVNIDGRTDRNRGLKDNTFITPSIFNLMNSAYTQDNNFFPINYYDPSKIRLQNFNNVITWTTVKNTGSLVDRWTNVTMAATLDMDGDKGDITMLRVFNNNIYSFQPKGMSVVKFNSNTALSTTEGTPVELANSGRVEGKQYILNNIGCSNKWASVITQSGIYFIDDLNGSLYGFNGELANISERQGFDVLFEERSNADIRWNPVDFGNAILYYDNDNHEIHVTYGDRNLTYSEIFNAFTSFYSYESVPFFVNVNGRNIMVMHNYDDNVYKLWDYQKGEYNMFFGQNRDYYTEIVVNDVPDYNKLFDTVEFTVDAFDGETPVHDYTFNELYVRNSYQEAFENLEWKINTPSSLKKKFRTWRTPIPRCNYNTGTVVKRDRIQDHWAYVKLYRRTTDSDKNRHILYNTNIYYYI